MDRLESNIVYRVQIIHGPRVRILVQTYADGDACFSARPKQGEFDEPPAMNAIAALLGYLTSASENIRITKREYRFPDDRGGCRIVKVPDRVIVPGGAHRVRELLLIIQRATVTPPAP